MSFKYLVLVLALTSTCEAQLRKSISRKDVDRVAYATTPRQLPSVSTRICYPKALSVVQCSGIHRSKEELIRKIMAGIEARRIADQADSSRFSIKQATRFNQR